MNPINCVGALIVNEESRVFVQRRTRSRSIFPGTWDIVGGHLKPGETPMEGLAREIEEETGWKLRRVVAQVSDWEWEHDGVLRREADFVVEVDGDLDAPRLEPGKHDKYAWVGLDNVGLMAEGRAPEEDKLQRIVTRALNHYEETGSWHGVPY